MTFFERIFPGVRIREWPDPVTGIVYFAPREACGILGLDWPAHRSEVLCSSLYEGDTIPGAALTSGTETVLLDIGSLPFWLFQIPDNEVRPELRARLIAFQEECGQVMREHCMPQVLDILSCAEPEGDGGAFEADIRTDVNY